MNVRFSALFLLLSIAIPLAAQFGEAEGGHPPWINWRQIETDSVHIIFPQGLEKTAQRTANLIHYMSRHNQRSIGPKSGKVDILFRNQNVTPNGFVGFFPFRSEFFTTPPLSGFGGTVDWMDLLGIHEYRHVMQNNNSEYGIARLAHTVAGEAAWAGLVQLAIPNWFDEGDAVVQETALTRSGRGRLPDFTDRFKALALEDKLYSYEKLRNGSLKDLLPNHYPLGYLMNTYARRHFGNDVWANVYKDAVKYKGLLFPFSRNLKRRTGLSTTRLYRAALMEMDSIWEANVDKLEISNGSRLTPSPPDRTPTVYGFPQFTKRDEVIAVKTSFKEIPHIYLIDAEGHETKIHPLGRSFTNYFSFKHNKVLWHELAFHPRWSYVNYSILKLYDLQTGKLYTLTANSRLQAPDLSHDSRTIVAVENTANGQYRLKLFDAHNTEEISALPNPDNLYYKYPRWTSDDQAIIVVAQRGQENALLQIDLNSGRQDILVPYTSNLIQTPFVQDDYVYFSSALNGTDNIYGIKTGESTIYQITEARVGANQPSVSPDGKWLLFVETDSRGNHIRKMALDRNKWRPVALSEPVDQPYLINPIAEAEGGNILDNLPERHFPVGPYKPIRDFIKFHSLAFFPEHPSYSLFANATNYLGTFNVELGPSYDYDENNWTFVTRATYAKLFTVADLNYNSSFDRGAAFLQKDTIIIRRWDESELSGALSVPLNFSSGHQSRFLNAGVRYAFRQLRYRESENGGPDENLNTVGAFLDWSVSQRAAVQQINTRFGHRLVLGYRQSIEKDAGQIFYARGTLYLPGLSATHSLYFTGGYQRQSAVNRYKFSNFYRNPRGFSSQIAINDDIYGFGVNYSLPLLYPDLAVGPFLFLKRLRANFFYDHSISRLHEDIPTVLTFRYQSVGIELSGDFGLIRSFDLPLGVRFSYLVEKPEFVDRVYEISFILQ